MRDSSRALGLAPVVEVGPFWVDDADRRTLVARILDLEPPTPSRPVLAYALHVGGLNARADPDFVLAMRSADVVYADGGSVVWLAKLAGADHVERAPTTDVGWDIMRGFADKHGRLPLVALLGGPEGLAERAAAVLRDANLADVVATEHGYQSDWTKPLARVRTSSPDIVFVGLGAPREMVWCRQHLGDLPAALVLTCGGWFGHIVGDERRAPRLLRRSGVEWISRLAQSPRRLGPRYALGVGATARVAVSTLRRRRSSTAGSTA